MKSLPGLESHYPASLPCPEEAILLGLAIESHHGFSVHSFPVVSSNTCRDIILKAKGEYYAIHSTIYCRLIQALLFFVTHLSIETAEAKLVHDAADIEALVYPVRVTLHNRSDDLHFLEAFSSSPSKQNTCPNFIVTHPEFIIRVASTVNESLSLCCKTIVIRRRLSKKGFLTVVAIALGALSSVSFTMGEAIQFREGIVVATGTLYTLITAIQALTWLVGKKFPL